MSENETPTALPATIEQGGDLSTLPANPTIMDVIARAALKDEPDIEVLNGLYELKKKFDADEARRQFNQAKAAWKKETPAIYKTKAVGYEAKGQWVGYKHADLGEEIRLLEKSLAEFGLSISWKTGQDGAKITVSCMLSHQGGHTETETIQGMADATGSKNAMQAIGSGVKYLRRYTMEGVLGVAPQDEDDDGAGAGKKPDPLAPKKDWRDEYAKLIEEKADGLSEDDFTNWAKANRKILPNQTWCDFSKDRAENMMKSWHSFVALVREHRDAQPE